MKNQEKKGQKISPRNPIMSVKLGVGKINTSVDLEIL